MSVVQVFVMFCLRLRYSWSRQTCHTLKKMVNSLMQNPDRYNLYHLAALDFLLPPLACRLRLRLDCLLFVPQPNNGQNHRNLRPKLWVRVNKNIQMWIPTYSHRTFCHFYINLAEDCLLELLLILSSGSLWRILTVWSCLSTVRTFSILLFLLYSTVSPDFRYNELQSSSAASSKPTFFTWNWISEGTRNNEYH